MRLTDREIEEINLVIANTKQVFSGSVGYFVIKSNSYENLETSMKHSAWATTLRPTKKLQIAHK